MEIEELPKNLASVVEYLNHANDLSNPLEATIGAVYSQVSRFLCYNRVFFEGMKGLEYPMLYFISFAPSGAYKDEVIRQLANACEDSLKKQKQVKLKVLEIQKDYYAIQESNAELKTKAEKLEYRKHNYPIEWRNTFVGGTSLGLHVDRLGMMNSQYGSLHFEHSEIMDFFSKKDSNLNEILSYFKDSYSCGSTRTETIASDRRKNIDGVPMTMFLHGVSTGLKENRSLYDNLLYVLESGTLKRCFFIYNDTQKRKPLNLEERAYLSKYVELNKDKIQNIFLNLFDSIKPRIKINDDYTHSVIQDCTIYMDRETMIAVDEYRNENIIDSEKTNSKLLSVDILDRYWRAIRLSVCVAMLEHPNNPVVTLEDFNFAKSYIEEVGKSFSIFLRDKNKTTLDEVFEKLKESKHPIPTGIIKKIAKLKYKQETIVFFEDLREKCEIEGYELLEEKASKNLKIYSVIRSCCD